MKFRVLAIDSTFLVVSQATSLSSVVSLCVVKVVKRRSAKGCEACFPCLSHFFAVPMPLFTDEFSNGGFRLVRDCTKL